MLHSIEASDIQVTQEDERRRLARELHDGVIQSLTTLVDDLEQFRSRHSIMQAVDENVDNWHSLAHSSLLTLRQALGELRKTTGGDFDFMAGVLTLLKSMQTAGYLITFACHDWPSPLSGEYAINLYYVLREALLNICKHAAASSIAVSLSKGENCLHMHISDDGIGMSTVCATVSSAQDWHQGLRGLRERVALLGGQVSIESMPAQGTNVQVDLPLPVRVSSLLTYSAPEQPVMDPSQQEQDDDLTPRERELVILIARGFVVKEIARRMTVSEKTVRNHISNVYHKLSIYDRSQLVIYAMKKGMVNLQSL